MTESFSSRTWQDRATLGIYVIILGQFCHVTGGIFEKMLLGVYPVPQMTFIRSLLRLVFLAAMLIKQKEIKAVLLINQPICSLLRICTYIAYNYCMLYALSLASLTASCSLLYATPFFTLILSAWILKEKISKHKWIALSIASIGVGIAIRSNSGFEWVFLVILFGALIGSLNRILIRRLVATEHSLTIAITGNAALALVLVPFIFMDWHPVSWGDLGVFAIAGFLTAIGQYATVQALRFAQASTLAPFDYTTILWASLFDFFIWDVTPSSHFILGCLLIIGSNLYLIKSIKSRNSVSS